MPSSISSVFFEDNPENCLRHKVNIEPLPSGNKSFLVLLKGLRRTLPKNKMISVAAYPPPTRWRPFPDVHWEKDFFQEVSALVDQMAVMMYDTSLRWSKPYQSLMSSWTRDVLSGSSTKTLLGLPAYDDAGVGYHDPTVENLKNSLRGIHAGLSYFPKLPENYQGVSTYCEWEMTDQKWNDFQTEFEKNRIFALESKIRRNTLQKPCNL